jgi:hypothetical protein
VIFVYFIVIHLSTVIGEWLSSFMVSFVWTKFTDIPFIGEGSSTYKRGRITLNGKANCPQRMGELLTYSAAPAR